MAPSARGKRRHAAPRAALFVLAALGGLISAYLTWTHFAGLAPICTGGDAACETVQSSRYATILGVPVALLGLIAYCWLFLSAALWEEAGIYLGVLVSLVGTLFSAYLTYLEVFVIGALCQWCLTSAVIMVAALICTSLAAQPLLKGR